MKTKILVSLGAAALLLASLALPAFASDHLFNAANAPGAAEREFANPVATNPSSTSGAAASPGTVPGEGNPAAGDDRGTPAANLDMVDERSDGHGFPAQP